MRTPLFLLVSIAVGLLPALSARSAVRPLERGCALIKAGDYTSAVHELEAIYEPGTASPSLTANLAFGCFKQGRTDRAIELLTGLANTRPMDPLPTELLAHVMMESGNLEGADALLAQVTAPTPRMRVQRALIAYRAGRGETARDLLGLALERDAAFAPALYNAAILQRDHFRDASAAATAYSRFQLMAIHDPRAGLTIDEFVSRSTEPAPPTPDPVVDPALKALLVSAAQADAEGDLEAAIYHLKDAIRRFPDRPDALWELGTLYAASPALRDPAIEMYTKFRQLFPRDARLATIPADIMEVILAQTGPSFDELFQAGLSAYSAAEFNAAADAYAAALAANPDSQTSAFNLGLARKQLEQLPAAAAAFKEAIAIDPTMLNSRYMLGVTEKARGNTREALKALHTVVAEDPTYTLAYYLLGVIYSEEARSGMARENLERALQLGLDASWAAHARQLLGQQVTP